MVQASGGNQLLKTVIQSNLRELSQKVGTLTDRCLLLAVSKTKSIEDLQAAYDAGQRHFGENYVDELAEKVGQLPNDISWHFIGHLQTNKVKKLVTSVPNLALFETVGPVKLATKLNKEWSNCERPNPLHVLVQVNTSEEASKGGVSQTEVPELVNFIRTDCPVLKFSGLMAMGAVGDLEGFQVMKALRDTLVTDNLPAEQFILSMGTSGDFEPAIQNGATEVRLGSTIFGARNYPNRA